MKEGRERRVLQRVVNETHACTHNSWARRACGACFPELPRRVHFATLAPQSYLLHTRERLSILGKFPKVPGPKSSPLRPKPGTTCHRGTCSVQNPDRKAAGGGRRRTAGAGDGRRAPAASAINTRARTRSARTSPGVPGRVLSAFRRHLGARNRACGQFRPAASARRDGPPPRARLGWESSGRLRAPRTRSARGGSACRLRAHGHCPGHSPRPWPCHALPALPWPCPHCPASSAHCHGHALPAPGILSAASARPQYPLRKIPPPRASFGLP